VTPFVLAALLVGPTFNKDVLPILQKNCQGCHRTGEIAPMALETYQDVRPYAKAIKAAVLTRQMPPWFADARYGHWANAPKLTDAEIRTLAAWADNGALEGEARDKPAAVEWPKGWSIHPDLIVKMPKPVHVPAKGTIELTTVTLATGLNKDAWITSIEVRPGNARVVHHVAVSFRPHDPRVRYGEPETPVILRDANGDQIGRREGLANFAGLEGVFLPGSPPMDFRIHNAAKLIPTGYDVVLQIHYTAIGEDAEDQTQVGFSVAKEAPARRFITLAPAAARDEEAFVVPAGDGNWETSTEVEFKQDAEIVWFLPHMHLRGKDMTYELEFPNGEKQIVLRVPKYDFHWQLGYDAERPIKVTKGTRLRATAHFDNSANNKANPNPNKDVRWGDQTWEEMMVAWFGVVVDRSADPRKVVSYSDQRR
jgi:hypothetical protein